MSFTNDDLEQLEEHLLCRTTDEKQADLIRALLTRLKSSEFCVRYLEAIPESQRSPRENEALNVWRKSCGEVGE